MIWTKIRIIKRVSCLLIFLFNFAHFNLYADERIQAAIEQINIISKDLKIAQLNDVIIPISKPNK